MVNHKEHIQKIYDDMNHFIDKTGKYFKDYANISKAKSDNPNEYLPRNHLNAIETMLMDDPKLVKNLINLYESIQKHTGNTEKIQDVTKSYGSVINDIL
jgi:hypothetical protein